MERLAQIETTIKRIRLTRSIVQGASLDAFHLVSALAIRERRGIELSFATHDTQQTTAARALGFTCLSA